MGARLRDPASGKIWELDPIETWIISPERAGPGFAVHEGAGPETGYYDRILVWLDGTAWRARAADPLDDPFFEFEADLRVLHNGERFIRTELESKDELGIRDRSLVFENDGERIPETRRLPSEWAGRTTAFADLVEEFEGKGFQSRSAAGELLLRFAPRARAHAPLRNAFLTAIGNPSAAVRDVAARGVAALVQAGAIESAQGIRVLTPLLEDDDLSARMAAGASLSRIDPLTYSPALHAALLAALEAGHETTSIAHAARALVGGGSEPLVSSLRRQAEAVAMDATARKRRASAAAILGELAAGGDGTALRPLRTLLADTADSVRAAAARAIGHAPGEDALRALLHVLGDPSGNVAAEAISALAERDEQFLADRVQDEIVRADDELRKKRLIALLEEL